MTTVRQLIDMLNHGGNLDAIVVLAHDGEGNSFSPLADIDSEAVYVAETTWNGAVYADLEEAEDDSAVPCVCLWPVN